MRRLVRAYRRSSVVAVAALLVAVSAMLAAAGCGPARHSAANGPASTVPQAHRRAPAPANPDLGTLTERFYQYVEGGHWQFAYAMLSARYRATLTQDELKRRYESFADADVALRQPPGTVVTARLDATDRTDHSRKLHADETLKLAWDGEQWTIDDIVRRP
ncbi:MAG: hypothetical protein QOJ39_3714 [Candidatus Eremiobacteraeota bacterium]|jgi:hypothetical protein|nr:hypothetical protein [Candidatus Eremiobacteraeota bacterium]